MTDPNAPGARRTEEAHVWFKSRGWIPVAWLLCFGNLIAVWFPQPIAPWHSASHAIAALLFGLGAQRLAQRRRPAADSEVADTLQELEDRLGTWTDWRTWTDGSPSWKSASTLRSAHWWRSGPARNSGPRSERDHRGF